VNTLLHITISLFFGLAFVSGVFATSNENNTSIKAQPWSTTESGSVVDENGDENQEETPEVSEEKAKILDEIASITIALRKKQNDKILKDIEYTFQKQGRTKEEKIQAYESIRNTLEKRRLANNNSQKITDPTMRKILYITTTHLIDEITKQIEYLKK
jgi:hypothetical protein